MTTSWLTVAYHIKHQRNLVHRLDQCSTVSMIRHSMDTKLKRMRRRNKLRGGASAHLIIMSLRILSKYGEEPLQISRCFYSLHFCRSVALCITESAAKFIVPYPERVCRTRTT